MRTWAEISGEQPPSPATSPRPGGRGPSLRDRGFVMVGDFARAVGRSPETIRIWERTGVVPKLGLRLNADGDPRRQRRVYPLRMVEAVRAVAEEHGLHRRRVQDWDRSDFPEDAWRAVLDALDQRN